MKKIIIAFLFTSLIFTLTGCFNLKNQDAIHTKVDWENLDYKEFTLAMSNRISKYALRENLQSWATETIKAAQYPLQGMQDQWGFRLTEFLQLPGPPIGQYVVKRGDVDSYHVTFHWTGPKGFYGIIVGNKSLNYSSSNLYTIKCAPGIYAWHGIITK